MLNAMILERVALRHWSFRCVPRRSSRPSEPREKTINAFRWQQILDTNFQERFGKDWQQKKQLFPQHLLLSWRKRKMMIDWAWTDFNLIQLIGDLFVLCLENFLRKSAVEKNPIQGPCGTKKSQHSRSTYRCQTCVSLILETSGATLITGFCCPDPTIWEHESLICSVHHALNCAGHSLQDFLRCTQRHLSLMDSAHETCWHNQQGSETVCNSPPMSTHRTPMFFNITALKKPVAQKIFSDIDLQKKEKRLSSQKKTRRQFSNIKRNRCKNCGSQLDVRQVVHLTRECCVLTLREALRHVRTWSVECVSKYNATTDLSAHRNNPDSVTQWKSEENKKERSHVLMRRVCWIESGSSQEENLKCKASTKSVRMSIALQLNLLHAFNKLNFLVSSTRTPILVRLFVLLDAWTFLNSQKKDLHCCPTLVVCLHAFCLMFGLCLHHAHQHASLLSFVSCASCKPCWTSTNAGGAVQGRTRGASSGLLVRVRGTFCIFPETTWGGTAEHGDKWHNWLQCKLFQLMPDCLQNATSWSSVLLENLGKNI